MLLERILSASNASIFRNIDHTATKAVFHPRTLQEVRDAIHYANKHGLTITVKGGGTSLSGASTGGIQKKIIIVTNKLRNLLEVNQEQRYAWIEPGLTPVELNTLLEKKGIPLRYVVSPSSQNVATLGGMLATDAGGNDAWIRGTTRDNLLSVEIMDYHGNQILTTKEDVRCANKEVQRRLHEIGFGLDDIAASHGSLGFITKMQVILHSIASEACFWAKIKFDGLNDFGTAIKDMIQRKIPLSYTEAIVHLNKKEIDSEINTPLLIVEAPETQKSELEAFGDITPVSKDEFEELKKLRKALSKKIPKSGINFPLFEGYGVHADQLPNLVELMTEINEILRSYNTTPFIKFGHAPSKWYDQDKPCYGFIMHSREVRPEKTGKELIEIISTLIDFCLARNITPKPEHKWPYLPGRKRDRLVELAMIFENTFNPFVHKLLTEDLADLI